MTEFMAARSRRIKRGCHDPTMSPVAGAGLASVDAALERTGPIVRPGLRGERIAHGLTRRSLE
jgi:hypothetical protein